MILLDTHVWVWWAGADERLPGRLREAIESHRADGLGVSAISCGEVAKLVEYNRLELTMELTAWMDEALRLPGVQLIDLTPRIAIASTQLPGRFHRDPADQILVATARTYDVELATSDYKIQQYAHVRTT